MASVAVRIDETLYELAKAEAKRQHRSIAKQIELWLSKGASQTPSDKPNPSFESLREALAAYTPSVDEFIQNRQIGRASCRERV